MILQGDLQRGVDGLGAGVGEEQMREFRGQKFPKRRGQLLCPAVRTKKAGGEVKLEQLRVDGRGDLWAAVTSGRGEEGGAAVEDALTFRTAEVIALCRCEGQRRFVEVAVGGERKPVTAGGFGCRSGRHGLSCW